jgi:hypothetical protein
MICERLIQVDIRSYDRIIGDEFETGFGRVDVVRTPCHFGGTRPWFLCPRCRDRKAVLYIVGGAVMCRSCGKLRYRMETATVNDRRAMQIEKCFEKLGGPSRYLTATPPQKPKGMHWTTYLKICRRIRELQAQRNAAFEALVERMNKSVELD